MSIACAELAPNARVVAVQHHHHWDRLRILAMLDVVSWHLGGVHAGGGFGLPLFHMLSVALSVSTTARRSFVQTRARRLLLPWLFWSLLFAALRALENVRAGLPLGHDFEARMLLYGANIHLWFLPFTVLSTSVAHAARGIRWSRVRLTALWGTALVLLPLPLTLSFGWPFDQWLFSVPACLLGFIVGRARPETMPIATRALLATLLAIMGLWLGTTSGLDADARWHLLRFLLAFSALLGATWLPDAPDRVTSFMRPLLLGIYIVHPVLYAELLHDALWKLGAGRFVALCVLTSLAASGACVWLLRRTPLRRFV